MGGMLVLLAFLLCGVFTMDGLLRREAGIVRVWTGLCCGFILMMWLPALFAFFLNFTILAQCLGLGAAAALAVAAQLRARGKRENAQSFLGDLPLPLLLGTVVPFMLLSAYLQYTHILRPVNGALHVGQSTYGDLSLHLGIATSLVNAPFPPDYSILKGALLGYPFLGDSMVTTMLLMGADLAQSFVVTGTIMMTLVFTGFVLFAWRLTRKPAAVAIAFLLMFVNGGLGFLYTFDGVMRDSSALREVFTGFYKTPTNQPALNLRWVNVIVDMMVPQRTLLTGWMALLPALYLLLTAIAEKRYARFALLGVWGGSMTMIHTHSFLALGLVSLAAMLYTAAHPFPLGEGDAPLGEREASEARIARGRTLRGFLLYGCIAVLLAAPQLLTWSMPQTLGGGSLRLRFNWVNNQGDGHLIDEYFWFWIKNVGLVYILAVPAILSCRKGGLNRMLGWGALLIYTVAECIQFQPNEYDNNKLFYVAFMVILPAVGAYLCLLWEKLRGVRGRALFAVCTAVALWISGGLSIAREVVSDYELFGMAEVQATEYIRENTAPKAMFLTGQQHNNAVAALTGRYIVCGTGSYLYFHGLDYSQQQADARRMLEAPSENEALFGQYGVDYVYLSSHEKNNFAVDEDYFSQNFEQVYSDLGIEIYAVPEELRA